MLHRETICRQPVTVLTYIAVAVAVVRGKNITVQPEILPGIQFGRLIDNGEN